MDGAGGGGAGIMNLISIHEDEALIPRPLVS